MSTPSSTAGQTVADPDQWWAPSERVLRDFGYDHTKLDLRPSREKLDSWIERSRYWPWVTFVAFMALVVAVVAFVITLFTTATVYFVTCVIAIAISATAIALLLGVWSFATGRARNNVAAARQGQIDKWRQLARQALAGDAKAAEELAAVDTPNWGLFDSLFASLSNLRSSYVTGLNQVPTCADLLAKYRELDARLAGEPLDLADRATLLVEQFNLLGELAANLPTYSPAAMSRLELDWDSQSAKSLQRELAPTVLAALLRVLKELPLVTAEQVKRYEALRDETARIRRKMSAAYPAAWNAAFSRIPDLDWSLYDYSALSNLFAARMGAVCTVAEGVISPTLDLGDDLRSEVTVTLTLILGDEQLLTSVHPDYQLALWRTWARHVRANPALAKRYAGTLEDRTL
jgi:hypothetical protein